MTSSMIARNRPATALMKLPLCRLLIMQKRHLPNTLVYIQRRHAFASPYPKPTLSENDRELKI